MRMAPTQKTNGKKPSKVVKPSKSKKEPTISTKNHRFQSFSQRVANLKIDPIRRRRKPEDREELGEDTATYFGRSLTEWRDLNLSTTFTAFAKEAAPLCDSLPVVLHNEERIIDLLVTYIAKADALALEPLLSLLSHFAHDLDSRFEKHFQGAVNTVASVAAKHPDPAVVEWCFNCLAWLFKYLARLLTPDLRPLYDLMAPYLGKQPQRPFIIRFAAESMSFLVRKAAARYQSDHGPLDLFISHVFENCQNEAATTSGSLFEQGISTLLTASIKGIQSDIHSSGLFVLQSMLKHTEQLPTGQDGMVMSIVKGTLTSLIHDATQESFRPIQDTVLSFAGDTEPLSTFDRIRISAELIFTITTVRKGSRISDWPRIIKLLKDLLDAAEKLENLDGQTSRFILATVTSGFQYATLNTVLPALDILDRIRTGKLAPYFLRFCDLFARLDNEKFQNLLLPQFQKFVLEQSEGTEDVLLLRLPALVGHGKKISCSDGLQKAILSRCERLTTISSFGNSDETSRANLAVAALPFIKFKSATQKELEGTLLQLLKERLDSSGCDDIDRFAVGAAFNAILESAAQDGIPMFLWPSMCSASPRFLNVETFWVNMARYTELCGSSLSSLDWSDIETLKASLLECLSVPSHNIRQSALDSIRFLYQSQGQEVPGVIDTTVAIESTPVSFESSRSLSMNIRRLAAGYADHGDDEFLRRAIPTYCFGLLNLQLSQAWDDAISALSEMSKSSLGEEVIIKMVQAWLEAGETSTMFNRDDTESSSPVLDIDSKGFQVVSDFECSNLSKVVAICEQVFEARQSGHTSAGDRFRAQHLSVPRIPSDAREKALKVLNRLPALAEKRSRMLVPLLLRWAGAGNTEPRDGSHDTESPWSRKDQKLMLSVFSQFTNAKVLFKAAEVYGALLNLCSNGDVEIQRSALKAILAWKEPAVVKYEEHLGNLLDEARFSDQLSVFVQDTGDDKDNAIAPADYTQLMPVLLRLLYGRAVAASKNEQNARRKAIFVALSTYREDVLGMFVDIALGSARGIALVDSGVLDERSLTLLQSSPRQQLGMVNMLDNMLETLGSRLEPSALPIVNALLLCSVWASRQIGQSNDSEDVKDFSLRRSIRQAGTQALAKAFIIFSNFDLAVYAKIVADELIAPRLINFAAENTQSISGVLRLLAAWTSSGSTHRYLLDFQGGILDAVASLLGDTNAKDNVVLFILEDIVDKIATVGGQSVMTASQVTAFVRALRSVLVRAPAKHVLDASVNSFTKLATHIRDQEQAEHVVNVCSDLLTKPSSAVSNATKVGLLRTILPLLDLYESTCPEDLYNAICGLFSRLHERESRTRLSAVLLKICAWDDKLLETAQICQDLNAVGGRLDESNHVRKEAGFSKIYEKYKELSLQQWKAVVHNCLFYIQDTDDLVNRTSAARALERFIDAASISTEDFKPLLSGAMLPGIVHGMKNPSELVRSEYVHLLGHMVENLPSWTAVTDMKNLTAQGDDEASFFTNVLHIQQHRRLRALRRLSDESKNVSSQNATQLFFPLLENFVFEQAPGDAGRTLADQAITTLGALSTALNWSSFRATFKRYVKLLGSEDHGKIVLRLLNILIESRVTASTLHDKVETETSTPSTNLKRPVFGQSSDTIIRDMLTPLTDYLHLKDESTVDKRMPVAVTVVRILKWLPEQDFSARLPPALTDICHVLKSRSQEARDQTRKTLCQIAVLIGPTYFGFILKELRGALQRGYQLHVLSFTVHSLLLNAVENIQPGDLNSCLTDLVSIVMDDIFGSTGQEKDAEDYKSTMKEVKSSKSFDTMELLATITPIRQLGMLIKPIQALLSEKLNTKTLRKADDLLTRVRKGIDRNTAAHNSDMLIFCYEVATHTKQTITSNGLPKSHQKAPLERPSTHVFRIISFAFDLLRKLLRRHDDLATAANLTGFLPVLGDALVEGQDEVQVSALKLIATIMKVSIDELNINAPVYVREAVRHILAAPNMTTDAAKTGLELITSVLRDRPGAQVRDKDLADTLSALKGSIDEPDRQGIVYKFLRAILSRRVMITEIYEVMDEVGRIMVTNADRNVRESARGAYLQFILEYPQSPKRWKKQLDHLVENLQFQHSSGRQSVMELLFQLLTKAPEELSLKIASKVFLPLVLIQNGDQDESCREMARLLLAKLFEAANNDQLDDWLALLDKWLQNGTSAEVQVAALQCWTILLRARAPSEKRMMALRGNVESLLSTDILQAASINDHMVENVLQTFEALVKSAPGIAFSDRSELIWKNLDLLLSNKTAARLLGAYFTHLASSSSKSGRGLSDLPLTGSGGLQLSGKEMLRKCYSCLELLDNGSEDIGEGVRTQTVRNLVFLGRCFAMNGLERHPSKVEADIEDNTTHSAFSYLFSRLSYIIRQENTPTVCRAAAIDCETALISATETVPNPTAILKPLYTLTDPSVPQSDTALSDKAQELMDLLQKRMGKDAYIQALSSTQKEAKERRGERRAKRKVELVTRPGKRTRVK